MILQWKQYQNSFFFRVILNKVQNILLQVVTDVQVFKKSVPSARAGDNVGLLLRAIKLDRIQRGMVLAAANSVKPGNRFRAQIYLLSRGEGGRKQPVVSGYIQMVSL